MFWFSFYVSQSILVNYARKHIFNSPVLVYHLKVGYET